MEVTGQFELPEELLDLERSGINEAAAFERSRARRSLSQAPSPPMGNPPAREMLGLNGEASRYTSGTMTLSMLMSLWFSASLGKLGAALQMVDPDQQTMHTLYHTQLVAAQYTTANPSCC